MQLIVEHIGVAASNPVSLKDWYVRVLGAKVIYESDTAPPAFFVRLSGGTVMEIYQGDSSVAETGQNRLAGWRHLALSVEKIESTAKELEAKGVKFEEPIKPAGGGGRVLFFRDVEGNLLHLVERPENSLFRT